MFRHLKKTLHSAIDAGAFPGAVVGILSGAPDNRQKMVIACGLTALTRFNGQPVSSKTYYDLASLSKPLATVLGVLCLIKAGELRLDTTLDTLLPHLKVPRTLSEISLRHLLGHTSGLPAHRPYFQRLTQIPRQKRLPKVVSWILQEPLQGRPGAKVIYSDLGYIILGEIIRQRSSLPLSEFVQKYIYTPMDITSEIFYNRPEHPRDRVYAATELCPWRRKVLKGQVHDDNAYALGGVAGHAGLFANIDGVLAIAALLLDIYQKRAEHPNFSGEDFRGFISTQAAPQSSWRLGFDTPSAYGSSSGHLFSPKSFGHLGFTGTSVWVDPRRDLAAVILSNRVHPTRENNLIKIWRPRIHDAIGADLSRSTR